MTANATKSPRAGGLPYRYIVLAACSLLLCINAAFPIYGAGVVNTAMATQMNLDRSILGLFVSANMAVTGLTAPLMGMAVTRFGARALLTTGSLLLIAGSSAMAFLVQDAWQAIAVFGAVMGLSMSAGGFVANQACVAGWFDEHRARAFAILYATMGVGGFVAPPLINTAIAGSGDDWRAGWYVFIAAGALAFCIAAFLVKDASGSPALAPQMVPEGAHDGEEKKPRSIWSSPALWLVTLCIVTAGASSSFYIAHGLAMLQDYGHATTTAVTSMSLMAGSTLLGNIIVGAFGDKVGVRSLLGAGLLVFALGLLLLAQATTTQLLFAYPVFLGAGFGAVQVSAMALLSKSFTPRQFAMASGLAISMQTVASAVTPVAAGQIYDASQTYVFLIYGLVAANCVAAALILTTRKAFRSAASNPAAA